MRVRIILECIAAAAIMFPATAADLSPHAVNTQRDGDEPPAAADLVRGITVPPGFRTVLFAAEPDVCQPIAMTTDERGRLWVVENYSYPSWRTTGTDRVLIFEDVDGDGRFDTRKVFLDGGRNLTGIEIGRGGVWLTSPPEIVFVPDRDRDDHPDGPPEAVLDGFNTDRVGHNVVNGLMWGPDGWLYGRHGIQAMSHVGRPGTAPAERVAIDCSIWRLHPQSHRFEVVARGTTNPWGLDADDFGEMVFTNNVNGHLWHLIPGAHYERMYGVDPEPHVYELMPQSADHLHWPGGQWKDSREIGGRVAPAVDALGGGHSHCGGLIYLGDMFPAEWRGKIFMCNTHGKRVNVDRLEYGPRGIVGRHEPDFLKAFDSWFRGIALVTGPDGRVWIADWTDQGECHDHDGVHRTSGRIYTVLHGEVRPPRPLDLHTLSDAELVELQLHPNDWFCRMSRRIIADRAAEGRDLSAAAAHLRSLAETHADPTRRLRGLWAAHAIDAADPEWLRGRLADNHQSVRAWAVRLLTDHVAADASQAVAAAAAVVSHADVEQAGLVRLHLAGALSRLPHSARWPVAESLATRAEDADWRSLSLLLWYGLRGPVVEDPARGAVLAATTLMATLRRLVARRLAFDADRSPAMAAALASLLKQTAANPERRADVAAGAAAAWEGRKTLALPADLQALIDGEPALARFIKPGTERKPAISDAAQATAAEIARLQTAGPSTPAARGAGIAAWQAKLTPDELSRADPAAGRLVWQQRCGTCHKLFGEGGVLGPELTGSGRAEANYVILNVMDPSAVVPDAWRLTQVITTDGRVVTGAVAAGDERTLTIRTPAGEMVFDREEIDGVITRNESVMPEGLWNDLSDEQVRDLVAYLASPVQVPLACPPPAAGRVGPWNLQALKTIVPAMTWIRQDQPIHSLTYAGEPYLGHDTEVFAFYASPITLGDAQPGATFPGVVLVHGGGGTAFSDWVHLWAKRGYSAIAMDLSGSRPPDPEFDPGTGAAIGNGHRGPRTRLPQGGPPDGHLEKFGSIGGETGDDWPFHAVANVIRAHTLLRTMPEVDADHTAVTGISWGGFTTCLVASLDSRFKAAVPVYGCGFLHEGESVQKPLIDALGDRRGLWVGTYDPGSLLPRCTVPIFFVNGTNDVHYVLDSCMKSFDVVPGEKHIRIEAGMPHGHQPGWAPSEIARFIDSKCRGGPPLPQPGPIVVTGDLIAVRCASTTGLAKATILFTTDTGPRSERKWESLPATITGDTITAPRPPDAANTWFVSVIDDHGVMVTTPVQFIDR